MDPVKTVIGVRPVRAGKIIAATKTAVTATRIVVTQADTSRLLVRGLGSVAAAACSDVIMLLMAPMCTASTARTHEGMSQTRQARGVPAGGQFTATAHAEAGVSLTPGTPAIRELIGPGTIAGRHPAWTPAAITKFLGEPDKLVTNPVFRNRGKMRMFLASRVAEVEAGEEWADWVASRKPSQAAGRGPVLTGRGRTGTYPVMRK